MKRIKQRLLLAAIVFMCAAPIASYAQLDGGSEFDPPNETDLPIDGGVSLLLVAGISYGAKKLYDKKKGDAENDSDK